MASKKILIDFQIRDLNASKTINKTSKAIDGLSESRNKLNTRTNKGNATAGLNNAILLETSRLASDASYGFQGMANNLGQVVQLLSMSAENSGGFGKALKDVGNQILGFGGVMIGIQLLISFLPQLEKLFVKLTRSVDPLNDVLEKSIEFAADSRSEFDTLTGVLLDSTASTEQKRIALERLNKDYPDFNANVFKDAENHREATKAIDEYIKKLNEKARSQAAEGLKQEEFTRLIESQLELETIAEEAGYDSYAELVEKREAIDEKQSKLGSVRAKTRISDTANLLIAETESAEKSIAKSQERIAALDKFITLQDESSKKGKDTSEDREKMAKVDIANYNEQIYLIRQLGKIREGFAKAERNLLLDNIRDNQTVIELDRQAALNEVDLLVSKGASQEQAAIARYQINSFYNKLSADDAIENQRRADESRMEMFSNYANALGSISKLIGENTKVGKAAALAEIVSNTAIGYQKGLIVAQEQSLEGGPFASMAFPLFYAAQIAAVLSGAAKAKSILSGGSSGGSSISGGGASFQAPDFNVVGASETSQLGRALASTQGDSEIKLYWSDIDDMNKTNERNENIVGFG